MREDFEQPKRFGDVIKMAEVGCWKLEHDKEPYIQQMSPELTATVLSLAARVPFEATRTLGSLYDIVDRFEDDSSALFSFKPFSSDQYRPAKNDEMPRRKDEVDMRFFSRPFKSPHGNVACLATIVRTADFRIQNQNILVGGRKIIPVSPKYTKQVPDWRALDWSDVEAICPMRGDSMIPWLGKLSVGLDAKPIREFESLASELHFAI